MRGYHSELKEREFLRQAKLKEFTTTKLNLQKMLKDTLNIEKVIIRNTVMKKSLTGKGKYAIIKVNQSLKKLIWKLKGNNRKIITTINGICKTRHYKI